MKKRILIEANNNSTPEYVFLDYILKKWDIVDYEIIPIGGKDKLKNNLVKLKEIIAEGGAGIIIFDADTNNNNGGFDKRLAEITRTLQLDGLWPNIKVFLWPNNCNDGDFETLLYSIVRRDLHNLFFDCFEDYEKCVAREYKTPNLKGKLHTYVTAQILTKAQRDKIGSGHWLFEKETLWDTESINLNPLREFIMSVDADV